MATRKNMGLFGVLLAVVGLLFGNMGIAFAQSPAPADPVSVESPEVWRFNADGFYTEEVREEVTFYNADAYNPLLGKGDCYVEDSTTILSTDPEATADASYLMGRVDLPDGRLAMFLAPHARYNTNGVAISPLEEVSVSCSMDEAFTLLVDPRVAEARKALGDDQVILVNWVDLGLVMIGNDFPYAGSLVDLQNSTVCAALNRSHNMENLGGKLSPPKDKDGKDINVYYQIEPWRGGPEMESVLDPGTWDITPGVGGHVWYYPESKCSRADVVVFAKNEVVKRRATPGVRNDGYVESDKNPIKKWFTRAD